MSRKTTRIALDAMGGDRAPHDIIKGGVAAAQKENIEVLLVGPEAVLREELDKHQNTHNVTIVHASEVVEMDEKPVAAVQQKKDSSIVVGIDLLKKKEASAFVSAGSTGAVASAALLNLGKKKGVSRPALAAVFPFPTGPLMFLDLGANADCKPAFLVQFARMGNVYMKRAFGVASPRIGLLSNGEEQTKGNQLVQKTHKMLKSTKMNFIGNVEGRDITRGVADVIVTDGFTGNVIIKLGESIGEMVLDSLRQVAVANPGAQGAAAVFQPVLRKILSPLDYAHYGGAILLGVNGAVIIAHGRSNAAAIESAIITAKRSVEQGIVDAIKG